MEILDHPSTIVREVTTIKEMEAVLEWPFDEQEAWIASLIREGEYHLQAFTGAPNELLAAWRAADPTRRVPLWREASAQHFAGGSYTEHDQKRFGYEPL